MNKTKIISFITAVTLAFSAFAMPVTVYGEDETNVVSQTSINSDEMSVSATNSFGELMTNVIESKTDEQQENQGYNIFSIEMDGSTANVSFETMEDCTLVVGIFNEQGQKMICSGSKEVTKEETETTIEIETTSMPQYYYLKGFMIRNTDFTPLCTDYASPNYTKEMQEFFTKTTEDFDEDRVLNLDEDTTNNFAVFNDEVKVIEPVSGVNIVTSADIENDKYVIENVDDSITSLNIGDTFAYEYEEGNYLIVNIAEIAIIGTTAVIIGADTFMKNIFDYVKIDDTPNIDEIEIDTSDSTDGITFNDAVTNVDDAENLDDIELWDMSINFSYDFLSSDEQDNFISNPSGTAIAQVSGSISFDTQLDFSTKFKFYVSLSYQYVELKIDYKLQSGLSLDGKITGDFEIGCPIIPFGASGVNIEIPIIFELEIEGELQCNIVFNGTLGVSYSSDTGTKNLCTNPKVTGENKKEITFFIGLAIKPRITFIHNKIFMSEFAAKGGIKVIGKMNTTTNMDCIHDCNKCLDGDINFILNFSFQIEFFNKEDFSIEFTSDIIDIKILDFYYSWDHEEFGFGTCPYISYRTTVNVTDTSGNPIKNATVYNDYKTDENGQAIFYLKNGEYTLTAKKSGYYDQSGDIEVADGPVELNLTLAERSELDINQTISMNNYHSAAITQDGKLYTWGNDSHGELGDGAEDIENYYDENSGTKNSTKPYFAMNNVRSVSVGRNNIAAITTDGKLYISGDNSNGLIGNGTYDVKKFIIGLSHRKYSIENDNNFQYVYALGHNVASVSMGDSHCGAVTKDGKLYMWGNNSYGQIGNGQISESEYRYLWDTKQKIPKPVEIPQKIMDNVKMVSCCGNHTAALTLDGDLYTWGNNVTVPTKILENVDYITTNGGSYAAITKDGELYMWGNCRIFSENKQDIPTNDTPQKWFTNNEKVIWVSPGQFTTAFITDTGKLYMWGYDTYNDETECFDKWVSSNLVEVKPKNSNISQIIINWSCATYGSALVTEDGKLYMWGSNGNGQLGDGTTTSSDTPKQVLFDGEDKRILQFDTEDETTEEESAETTSANLLKNVAFSVESNSKESEVCAAATNLSNSQVLYSTVSSSGNTYTFSGLEENKEYIFYVMKSRRAVKPFSSDNLLYIAQGISDSVGEITFESNPKSTVSNADIFLGGESARDINDAEITIENFEYDEKEHTPSCTVVYNGKTLVAGEDYDVTGDLFVTKQGTYSLTITGMGDYTGTVTKNFYVKGTNVQYMNVTLSKTAYVYTGNAIKPKVTVINGDDTLVSGTDYAVRYENNIDVGTAKVIIAGKGDYTGKVTKTFQIFENVTDISSCTVSISKSSYPYTGSAVKPTVTVKNGDTVLTKNTDYVVRYINNINIGTATIIISGKGDYIGTTNKTFSIVKNIGKCTVTLSTESCNYTGSAIKPKVTVKYGNTTLTMGTDYVMRYANNVNVGTASVVISGCNSYAGTITKTFEIVDHTINLSKCEITLSKTNYTYTGSAIKPKVTVKYNGQTLVSGTDYAVRYMDNTEKGTATVIISGKENYLGRIEKIFTIC